MSYLPTIDDATPTAQLLEEIHRRNNDLKNGVCPYCKADITSHSCKYKNRMECYHKLVRWYFDSNSVLQDWVMDLPLREQGTILTGIRGCDLTPKKPINDLENETPERGLVSFIRYCVLNPADKREVDTPGAFFRSRPPMNWRASELGHYPQHWYSHLMHCFEVVAYRSPDRIVATLAFEIYHKLVKNMHLNLETREQMINRLSEDRVKSGTIVS